MLNKLNKTTMIKTTDIKHNFKGYSQWIGDIQIYKDLTDSMWRVSYHYGLKGEQFIYKKDAVKFINKLLN